MVLLVLYCHNLVLFKDVKPGVFFKNPVYNAAIENDCMLKSLYWPKGYNLGLFISYSCLMKITVHPKHCTLHNTFIILEVISAWHC